MIKGLLLVIVAESPLYIISIISEMAPSKRNLMFRLVSSIGTGFFYVGKKSAK